MKIGIIGFGSMGQALLTMLEKFYLAESDELRIFNRSREKLLVDHQEKYYSDLPDLLAMSEVIFLAIKPHAFLELGLRDLLKESVKPKLFISVMAKVNLATMEAELGNAAIIRTMPNLAVINAEGLTVWTANQFCSDQQKELVKSIFESGGKSLECQDENLVDKVVLISGCGPGYLAYWYQLMLENTQALGFDAERAEQIVLQTVKGTTSLVEEYKLNNLVKKVCSEKGITEKILNTFQEKELPKLFRESMNVMQDD